MTADCNKVEDVSVAVLTLRAAAVLVILMLPASGQDPFDREIRPTVGRYCLACHSAAKHVGDLNLERFTSLQTVTQDPKVWQRVSEQISLGEMPPEGYASAEP